jgi:hypothetical protein
MKYNVSGENMASFPKDVRERLSLWDAKEGSLSPLTDEEKDSVLLLTAYSSNRSIPSEVSFLY